jgi:formylmethanofuran dehydrogenase subunit C
MSALTFTLKAELTQRIDLSPLTPDKLAGKSVADVAGIELHSGNRKLRVDEIFNIVGDDPNDIIIRNGNGKLDHIGSGMKTGRITVLGDAGDCLGFELAGGELIIKGNVDAFAGSGMKGGLIHIQGNAGDFLGGAIAGNKQGMKGGTVIVTGNSGDRVGDQMRRGLLLIEGNAGDYCGSRMIAGTIGVLGSVGQHAGYGMRRGTLLLTQMPRLHPTIMDCGSHTLPFLSLMFKSFAQLPTRFSKLGQNRVWRYAGDIANEGKGEILVLH